MEGLLQPIHLLLIVLAASAYWLIKWLIKGPSAPKKPTLPPPVRQINQSEHYLRWKQQTLRRSEQATPAHEHETVDGPEPTTKACPFCGESILAAARKCKHCQSLLDEATAVQKPSETLGIFALLTPFASAMLALAWIPSMSLLQGPRSTLALLGILTVLVTAALIAAEANRVGFGKTPGVTEKGPACWFIATVLLWVICFPLYFYQRSRHGLRNRCVAAVAATLCLVVANLYLNSLLESAARASLP